MRRTNNFYLVSNFGRVQSVPRQVTQSDGRTPQYKGRIRKLQRRKDGYFQLRLKMEDGKTRNQLVHRLVAKAFIPNPDNKPEVNHKDNNPENNYYLNLEWATTKENIKHAHANGHVNSARGEGHGRAKLTLKLVKAIRKWSDGYSGPIRGKWVKLHQLVIKKTGIVTTLTAVRQIALRITWKHV